MAENNTTQDNNTTKPEGEAAKPTAEELAKLFEALPGEFKEAIQSFNALAEKHNAKVDSVKAAESQDPKLIKAEIYEQNSSGNKKLAVLRERELKLQEQIEKIRKDAYEIIDTDGLMPKDLTPEEVEKLKGEVTEGNKELKDQTQSLSKLEEMLPMFKGKILIHLAEVKSRRGTGGSKATASGEGPKRPRFKRIEINGVTGDDKGNTVYGAVDGNEKYTFGLAAAYLKKQHKGIKWTTKDLQDAYYAGEDENNLPDVKEFKMPYTFKDESGNEHTVEYSVKCYR
jgi:hypothetical protein